MKDGPGAMLGRKTGLRVDIRAEGIFANISVVVRGDCGRCGRVGGREGVGQNAEDGNGGKRGARRQAGGGARRQAGSGACSSGACSSAVRERSVGAQRDCARGAVSGSVRRQSARAGCAGCAEIG